MHGQIEADLAAIPVENLIAILIGAAVLLIVLAVIMFVFIRKLGITGIGPFKMEHRGLSAEYRMNEAIDEQDNLCRKQMRQITSSIKINMSNIFAELHVCIYARIAVSSLIRNPLYESVANNHFTTELMPDNYVPYRKRIIDMLMEEYKSVSSASYEIHCDNEKLPTWEQVGKKLVECIDIWLMRVSKEVIRTCERKINIYKTYLNDFTAVNDKYRMDICQHCIEKNERYVTVLKDRIGRESEKAAV